MLLLASLTKDNIRLIVFKNVSEEPAGFLSPALSPLLQLRTNKQQSVRCYNFKQDISSQLELCTRQDCRSTWKKYNILQQFLCHFYYLRLVHSLKCLIIRESINYFSSLIRENKIYYQDNNCWLSPHCSDQSQSSWFPGDDEICLLLITEKVLRQQTKQTQLSTCCSLVSVILEKGKAI